MNTPDTDPFAYDEHLRALYDEAARTPPVPPARIWESLQTQLAPAPPPPPVPRRVPLLAGVGGLVLGIILTVLLGSWWPTPDAPRPVALREAAAPAGDRIQRPVATVMPPVKAMPGSVQSVTGAAKSLPRSVHSLTSPVKPEPGRVTPGLRQVEPMTGWIMPMPNPAPPVTTLVGGTAHPAGAADSARRTAEAAVPTVLLPLVQTETALLTLGADTSRTTRATRRNTLLAQRAALARLRYRTDSLLLALGEPLEAVGAAADSTVPPAPLRHRWSVALAFAPERNFFGLGAPAADTLAALRRTHEQGRAGYNAAFMAEYRLTNRVSVGAGLGLSSYGAELRLTDHRTTVSTHLDSTISTSTQINTVNTTAYIIRPMADSILAPITNYNNEIIGFHYLPVTRLDTVWTHLQNTELVTNTTRTYTPVVTTRQELSARVLKPNYRFLTVPVLLRYRLGRDPNATAAPHAARWWADVAVGAQFQFFLGGTQATTLDGLTYHTERVGPRGGPFRPWNLALTGAVAVNYALTPRLSASLAPTLRYQVESVYRTSTNLTQRPTATGLQLGLRYAF